MKNGVKNIQTAGYNGARTVSPLLQTMKKVVPAELHYNLGKNDVKLEKQHVKNELEKTGNGNCQLLWGFSDNTTCREFKNYLQGIQWGQKVFL